MESVPQSPSFIQGHCDDQTFETASEKIIDDEPDHKVARETKYSDQFFK
jgi:hypothetical protein